jgi:hypothetical protein
MIVFRPTWAPKARGEKGKKAKAGGPAADEIWGHHSQAKTEVKKIDDPL